MTLNEVRVYSSLVTRHSYFVTLMRLLIVFLVLIGCNDKPDDSKVTLEFWTLQLKPTFTDYIQGLLQTYEKEHPKVHIKWVDLPASEIEKKLLASIAGGVAPDVVNLNTNFTAKLANLKALAPIDEHLAKLERIEGKLPTKGTYFPNIWQASVIDGSSYGLPWYLSTALTIYNRELFKQAGLDPATPPKTYDDIYALGKKLKAKTGKYMMMPNFGDADKLLSTFVQQGVEILDAQGQPAFVSPPGERALKFWIQMVKDGIIPKDSFTEGHRAAVDRFQSGELAVLSTGPQFLQIIQENSPQLYSKIGVGPQLTGASGKIGVGIMTLVFPKASKHLKEGISFGQFVTHGENQLAFCKIVTILPSVKKAAEDPYFQKLSEKPELKDQARRLSAGQLSQAIVLVPPMEKSTERLQAFNAAVYQAVLGQLSPKQALEQAAAKWTTP